MPAKLMDITGQRFGRLVAKSYLGKPDRFRWLCQCDCGAETKVSGEHLRRGRTKSCGCLDRDALLARNTIHGHAQRQAKSPEYKTYEQMLKRCSGKGQNAAYYAGRGITVCERWASGDGDQSGFECFVADMGARPSADHSIDRIDNDGNYEPSNCRWATRTEQARNRRGRRMVVVNGEQMTLAEAAERAGLPYDVVHERVGKLGWTIEDALAKVSIGRWS